MTIDVLQTLEVIEAMENFIAKNRPPENIRHEVDLKYIIEEQSIIVLEVRPMWNNPAIFNEYPIAKTTFIKTKNNWKVFWLKSDNKWHSYTPEPTVKNVMAFTKIIEEDKHDCFWG